MERPWPADAAVQVLACEFQSAGRRPARPPMDLAPGAGLTFSLRWRFECAPQRLSGLSLAVGLAIVRALEELGVAGAALKWPNDVLADGRKLAGVLVELQSSRDAAVAVIGIGMNVHGLPDAPAGLAPAALDELLAAPSRTLWCWRPCCASCTPRCRCSGATASPPCARPGWPPRLAGPPGVHPPGPGPRGDGRMLRRGRGRRVLVQGEAGLHRILGGDVSLRTND